MNEQHKCITDIIKMLPRDKIRNSFHYQLAYKSLFIYLDASLMTFCKNISLVCKLPCTCFSKVKILSYS